MKVKCKISHEQPTETGFKVYEAGKEYDLDIFENKYFEEIEKPISGSRGKGVRGQVSDVRSEPET